MKKLSVLLILAAPACAQAMGMGEHMGMMHGMRQAHPFGLHAAVLLYGALAALGYFVLQHIVAQKEAPKCIAAVGRITGLLLVVVGLVGMLCGVAAHVRKSCHSRCCAMQAQEEAPAAQDAKGSAPKGQMQARDAEPKAKSR